MSGTDEPVAPAAANESQRSLFEPEADERRMGGARAAEEIEMEHPAITILNRHRIMAISTLREDGWPQTTIVGYANRGWEIFFLIFRTSQKFANIRRDNRISIAVGDEPSEMNKLEAVYAAAHAIEITEAAEREDAWRLLMQRHANLAGFKMPDARGGAFMRAKCEFVSMLDFSQGPGHAERLTVRDDGVVSEEGRHNEEWISSAPVATTSRSSSS